MSIQIQEIFEYKNKNFTLLGNPLYHYFEKRKDINFELLSSGLSRGYQGTWTIKDNKLFLIKLYCANYCIEDIFNAKAPVLAEWFSGNLEVGIGNRRTVDYFFPKFEYYLGLEIKRGVITERKIIKRFFDEPVLEFGQYRGLTFQNVLYGKIINEKIAIHNYIETLVQFLTNKKFNKNLLTPSVRFDEQSNNIINMLLLFSLIFMSIFISIFTILIIMYIMLRII